MIKQIDSTKIDIEKIKSIAEEYHRSSDFYCSEAVVKVIKDEFRLPISDEIIATASGFSSGMGGSGCTCGAITGGIITLGLIFGRTEAKCEKVNKAMELSNELHEIFRQRHKSLCCRVLTKGMEHGSKERINQCVSFTGEVAKEVAMIILRESDMNN